MKLINQTVTLCTFLFFFIALLFTDMNLAHEHDIKSLDNDNYNQLYNEHNLNEMVNYGSSISAARSFTKSPNDCHRRDDEIPSDPSYIDDRKESLMAHHQQEMNSLSFASPIFTNMPTSKLGKRSKKIDDGGPLILHVLDNDRKLKNYGMKLNTESLQENENNIMDKKSSSLAPSILKMEAMHSGDFSPTDVQYVEQPSAGNDVPIKIVGVDDSTGILFYPNKDPSDGNLELKRILEAEGRVDGWPNNGDSIPYPASVKITIFRESPFTDIVVTMPDPNNLPTFSLPNSGVFSSSTWSSESASVSLSSSSGGGGTGNSDPSSSVSVANPSGGQISSDASSSSMNIDPMSSSSSSSWSSSMSWTISSSSSINNHSSTFSVTNISSFRFLTMTTPSISMDNNNVDQMMNFGGSHFETNHPLLKWTFFLSSFIPFLAIFIGN